MVIHMNVFVLLCFARFFCCYVVDRSDTPANTEGKVTYRHLHKEKEEDKTDIIYLFHRIQHQYDAFTINEKRRRPNNYQTLQANGATNTKARVKKRRLACEETGVINGISHMDCDLQKPTTEGKIYRNPNLPGLGGSGGPGIGAPVVQAPPQAATSQTTDKTTIKSSTNTVTNTELPINPKLTTEPSLESTTDYASPKEKSTEASAKTPPSKITTIAPVVLQQTTPIPFSTSRQSQASTTTPEVNYRLNNGTSEGTSLRETLSLWTTTILSSTRHISSDTLTENITSTRHLVSSNMHFPVSDTTDSVTQNSSAPHSVGQYTISKIKGSTITSSKSGGSTLQRQSLRSNISVTKTKVLSTAAVNGLQAPTSPPTRQQDTTNDIGIEGDFFTRPGGIMVIVVIAEVAFVAVAAIVIFFVSTGLVHRRKTKVGIEGFEAETRSFVSDTSTSRSVLTTLSTLSTTTSGMNISEASTCSPV